MALVALLVAGSSSLFAQGNSSPQLWRRLGRESRPPADLWVTPEKFEAVALDHAAMRRELARAPMESLPGYIVSDLELVLPMPDGTMQRFRIVEAPVMAPELAALFPEIKTYVGQGIDDPTASVRLDLTPAGFHAQILSPSGAVYIDPHRRDASVYASYLKRDVGRDVSNFRCLTPADGNAALLPAGSDLARAGGNLRTYRLAVAATAEYTAYHGGTVAAGLAAVVTAVNRITGIYETELAVRFVLVANNNLIIYTSTNGDPFTNNNASSLLTENQATLDSVIGNANYDLGHVFSTAGGGLATRGCLCITGSKARGETGAPAPTGDAFVIDYVAHEIGHQMGANHTFNSITGNCGGANRNAGTAYEVGSGSTIMAYAGICGADDLQPHSDPFMHSISFDEIIASIGAGGCAVVTSTGNNAPTVNAGANYTIPASTPFILTAAGADADGDPLTYCWEERDLGLATTVTAADNGSSPLFRVFNPTTNTWRTFPKLANILNNGTSIGEKLPTTSRTMTFRATVRDNRAGAGGVNTDDMSVTVVATAGPFVVTSQPGGGTFSNSLIVTWNVANTTASPISAANVTISLSTNGGQTFPIVLLASTPNDGSQSVVLPNLTTSQARVKVQGAGNIFFDINGGNFGIVPGVPTPQVTLDAVTLTVEGCGPGNGAVDPGETVTVLVGLRNTGSANTTNLVATLQASGGVTTPSLPQNFGALVAGGGVVTLPFTYTASGSCGGPVALTLSLQDGPANLGNVGQASVLGGLTGSVVSFTNATAIGIPNAGTKGKASIYASTISVAGMTGAVSQVQLTLRNLTHSWVGDVDFLLVGPGGQKVLFLSDAGDEGVADDAVTGVTLTFRDDAAAAVSDTVLITSGTYLPTNLNPGGDSDAFSSPAPASPYATAFSVFDGTNPNGTWSLYVMDDANQDTGDLTDGWVLTLSSLQPSCCGSVANNPPSFPPLAEQAIDELQTLTFTNAATDPDGNTLSFSLADGPTNATIDAVSGVLVWTPKEAQGPATNVVQVVVADNGVPSLSVTQSLMVVVGEVNSAPGLAAIDEVVITEGGGINFTNTATDGDEPANGFSFSLGAAPTNATLHPVTGVFTWTTGEFDGPGTNLISVIITDTGVPSLSFTQTFTAIVLESNLPPALAPVASRVVHAGAAIAFTNSAADPDWPANALAFTLDSGAPATATLGPAGAFTWLTSDADANTTNQFTVRVADDGAPAREAAESFSILVQQRPVITSIAVTNGLVALTWSAIAGELYQVEAAEVSPGTNWVTVAGAVQATGQTAGATNGVPGDVRYFRVRWTGP